MIASALLWALFVAAPAIEIRAAFRIADADIVIAFGSGAVRDRTDVSGNGQSAVA